MYVRERVWLLGVDVVVGRERKVVAVREVAESKDRTLKFLGGAIDINERRPYQTDIQGLQQPQGSPVLQQPDPHIISHYDVTPTKLPARRYILNPRHENIQHPIPPLCRRTSSKVQSFGSSQCPRKWKRRFDLAGGTWWSNGKARTRL